MVTMQHQEEIAKVVRQVQSWTPAERMSLVREVLETLESELLKTTPRPSFERAAGLLKVDPTPSDEDIRRMIDEHRMEKYG